EYAYKHPASLPVGIVMRCWAARRASVRITRDGEAIFLNK
ncbi:fumarate hydratase, partial [Candidatus Geothermarchaeota archaeon]